MEKLTKQIRLTIAILNALVIDEAKKLKKNAKNYEIKKLNFERLDTQHVTKCVYGQMTGDCFSDRATELIEGSCKRVIKCAPDGEIDGTLNGSPKESNRSRYWSPIEVFIDRERNKKNGNNKRLVAYLKGETKELILK
ncbi:MAG: hypothetical protein AABY22_12075 [Nanoarchaeota archaeon]